MTRNGLCIRGMKSNAFYSTELNFRRFADDTEWDYLSNMCPKGTILLDKLSEVDDELIITIGEYVIDVEPEDYSLSSNGGDYEFGHNCVSVNGQPIGRLYSSSMGFQYCQISDSAQHTHRVYVKGTSIIFDAQPSICDDEISIHQFINLLQR